MANRKPITPPAITAEGGREREASVPQSLPDTSAMHLSPTPAKPGRSVIREALMMKKDQRRREIFVFQHSFCFSPISSDEINVNSGGKLRLGCRLTVSRLSRFVLLLVFLSLASPGWVSEQSKCEVPINVRLSHAGKARRRQRVQRFPLPSSAFLRLSYFQRKAASRETPTILRTLRGPTEGQKWSLIKVIILGRGSDGRQ